MLLIICIYLQILYNTVSINTLPNHIIASLEGCRLRTPNPNAKPIPTPTNVSNTRRFSLRTRRHVPALLSSDAIFQIRKMKLLPSVSTGQR